MAAIQTQIEEFAPPTPAPPALLERATALVKDHLECFWFRHPEARIRYLEDVRLVVEHLREYGDRCAWRSAQELHDASHLSSKGRPSRPRPQSNRRKPLRRGPRPQCR